MNFRLNDGSTYALTDPHWIQALSHTLQARGLDVERDFAIVEQDFAMVVEDHWDRKTVPTKFDHDEAWPDEYTTQAELAAEVMYQIIRVALMGIALSAATDSQLYVVGLNADRGAIKYTHEGASLLEESPSHESSAASEEKENP